MNAASAGLLLSGLLILSGCHSHSKREVWLIPDGFVGWLRLDYSVPGAPPLPTESGRYIVRMPRSGQMRTSTANNPSIDQNEYYSDDANGRHPLRFSRQDRRYGVQNVFASGVLAINANRKISLWQRPQITLECVYVGTGEDLKADRRNCSAWEWGAPAPPAFSKRPGALEPPR